MFLSSSHAGRRSSTRTAAKWLAIGITAVVVLGLLTAGGLWWYANSQLEEIDVPALDEPVDGPDGEVQAAGELEDTLNVLVVGNSSREGLTEQQLQELGTEDDGSAATDTIMIVQISPNRDKAVVVGFPRDLRVSYPSVGDVKINSVIARGGVDALVSTVQDLTGVDLDHYVEIDMAGFLDLAEVLGGVEICLDEPLVDTYAGIDLPAGCQTLDAADALGFVRSRRVPTEQFGADDFGRIAKQQYYLTQAMQEVTQLGTLANPLKVKRIIDAVAGAVTTDRQLGLTDMYRIANTLKGVTADDVTMRTVPGYWDQSSGFVVIEPEPAEALFQALRQGGELGDMGLESPDELAPGDVEVLIVNGVGIEGLASDVQDYLEERDFVVVDAVNPSDLDPDDDFDTTLQRSTIRHTEAGLARAELLRDHLGDVQVELEQVEPGAIPDGADVVLEVGAAWDDRT